MDFSWALRRVKRDPQSKVRRKAWSESTFIYLPVALDGFMNGLAMMSGGMVFTQWTPNPDDLLADDWQAYKE